MPTLAQSYIPDVQAEPAEIGVMAGIQDLRLIYEGRYWSLPIRLTILTSTSNHRGVHMSRLVSAAEHNVKGEYLEKSLRNICKEVDKSQPGARLVCELEYPYREQFMGIRLELSERGSIRYFFERTGITACPCSKKIAGIGHMQRTKLSLEITSREVLNFEEVALRMDECFSTVPEQNLKRTVEAAKVIEAQTNPRFVEDVVRECLKRFPLAARIEARSYESIHVHDAVAVWTKPRRSQRPALARTLLGAAR